MTPTNTLAPAVVADLDLPPLPPARFSARNYEGWASVYADCEVEAIRRAAVVAALARSAAPAPATAIVPDWPACNPGCDYETPHGGHEDHRSAHCSCDAAKASICRQRATAVEPSAEKVAMPPLPDDHLRDIDIVRAAVFKSPNVEAQHAFARICAIKPAVQEAWQVLLDAGVCPGQEAMSLADGIRSLLTAPVSAGQAELDAQLRHEVAMMYKLLDDGEWAEHIATTPHGQCLETAITKLVGKASAGQAGKVAMTGDATEAINLLAVGVDLLARKLTPHDAGTVDWLGQAGTLVDTLRAPNSAAAPADKQTAAARDVLAERRRQVEQEGWTPEHDDEHSTGEMAAAAACYALHTEPVGNVGDYLRFWPWAATWWKPTDRRRNLVKAGALILADIERLDRAAAEGASK